MKGRIPQHFIDELLARVDIVEVIDRRVSLKKTGRNFSACCPFHDEKTPSFSVNPDKQFYYCFGCGAGGNAVSFLMDYERLEFPRAIEALAQTAGMEVPREELTPQQAAKQERRRDVYTLLEQAADFYRRSLRHHDAGPKAIQYLRNRGLSGEICRDFDIGFAPPGWDNLIRELGDTPANTQLLVDGGMLVEKDGKPGHFYDRFRDRIIFPIRDTRGKVIAFGGRVLGDEKPKYLNSPETTVFHKGRELYGLYQARKQGHLNRLVVVEGYMDVVALAQHGIHYAVATLGTATSTDHLRKIFRYCPEVVFCFDGDEAGRRAANKALTAALPTLEDGRLAKFLFLPDGEDPDSLVRQKGSAHFEALVDNAQPLEDFLFESLGEDGATLESKARLGKKAAPLIQQLPEGLFKELMLDALAARCSLSRDSLHHVLEQNPPQPEAPQRASAADSSQGHDGGGDYSEYNSAGAEHYDSPSPAQREPLPSTRGNARRSGVPSNKTSALLNALAVLLHNPQALAICEQFNPQQLSAGDTSNGSNSEEQSQQLQALQAVSQFLRERPDSSSAVLSGYWLGEPIGDCILQALQIERPATTNPVAAEELDQIFGHLNRKRSIDNYRAVAAKLKHSSFAELSEEEQQIFLRHLAQKKPPTEE